MTRRLLVLAGALAIAGLLALLLDQGKRQGKPAPSPTPAATLTPAPHVLALKVAASSQDDTLRFQLSGQASAGAQEGWLWFDSLDGQRLRHIQLQGAQTFSRTLEVAQDDALTITTPRDQRQLDFWWLVRDQRGAIIQQAGTLQLPRAQEKRLRPPTVPAGFAWQQRSSSHFRFRFAPGSAAARDIEQIVRLGEESYLQASAVLSPALAQARPISLTIYLVPRVFWQGGVAYDQTLVISYLDRNYANIPLWAYLVHETIHGLAASASRGGDVGGPLGEGLAVFGTGDDYISRHIRQGAAAMLESDQLVRLCELRFRFHDLQHEQAYLQSAALVEFQIQRYGLERFLEHYLEAGLPPRQRGDTLEHYCRRMEISLANPFDITYGTLERDWHSWLAQASTSLSASQQLSTTVRFYDLMRLYEEQRDPDARLLPPRTASEWAGAALIRFLNAAISPTNVLQETMLIAAHQALQAQELDRAAQLLDEIEQSILTGRLDGALGQEYLTIDRQLQALARARRMADQQAYARLLAPGALERGPPEQPYSQLELELQQLDVRADKATCRVLATLRSLELPAGRLGDQRRQLYSCALERSQGRWLISRLEPLENTLERPPGPPDLGR